MTLSANDRASIRDSVLFLCLVSPEWARDVRCQAVAAYAAALHKPFRVVVWPDVHLPEDAFAGVTDLAIVRYAGHEELRAQVQTWLEELVATHGAGEEASP